MLHTYAPRTVDIRTIDEGLGKALRAAYRPGTYETWKVRPDVDIISATSEGVSFAPQALVAAIKRAYSRIGIDVSENETYSLHPATSGHEYSVRYPGRALCMELNRAVLADPFTPFAEMKIGADRLRRMSEPIVEACLEFLAPGGGTVPGLSRS